jgi:hypothetical protein
MPDKQDDLKPEVAEGRFAAAMAHHGPPGPGEDRGNDLVKDNPEPPDWHKQGKHGPPGWHQEGDTWAEGDA